MNEQVSRWAALIGPAARPRRLAPSLVAGLIEIESAGDPDCVSRAGAVGLMQVMPGELIPGRPTAAELHSPTANVEWGCQILADNRDRIGHQAGALAAYYGAADAAGTPNAATDGSDVDGWRYVRLVETAALDYLPLDQWADEDFQQYCRGDHSWRDAAINLLGICTDVIRKVQKARGLVEGVRKVLEGI